MADDAPLLGTTFVEIKADTSKLTPAFDTAEKKAKGAGRVIEDSLGGAYSAVQRAAKNLEKSVLEGNPRMQYGVSRYAAALNNLEKQIKATTSAGGTLTGDQVRQYAQLKGKLEELTPAVESQMRIMRASRTEVQAGVGAWTNWEATIARVLTDLGFKGAGEKALLAGGIFGALEAGVSIGEKLAHVLGTDKTAYESFWKDVEHAGHETQSRLSSWIADQLNGGPAENAAIRMMMGPIGAFAPGAWKPAELSEHTLRMGNESPGKLATPQETNQKNHFAEIEKRALEYFKERADLMNDTATSDKYARTLKDLELREEGYTDALMKDGDALRNLMVDRDQSNRQLERDTRASEARQKAFEQSVGKLFGGQTQKLDFFSLTPIPKEFTASQYTSYLKEIEMRMLSIGRAAKDEREQLRLAGREIAITSAEADIDKYRAGYSANVQDKSKGIDREEFMRLVVARKKLMNAELLANDERYASDFGSVLNRMLRSYGSYGDQLEQLNQQIVGETERGWQDIFFSAITGNIRGVKDAFKDMLNSILRDIINFMVRREVQNFLSLAANWYASNYGLPNQTSYAGISLAPASSSSGLAPRSVSTLSTPYRGGGGGSPLGGGNSRIHISLEPGLIATIVGVAADAGYARVVDDFNTSGPLRKTVRGG